MKEVFLPVSFLCKDGELKCLDGSIQCLSLFFETTIPSITQAQINPNPTTINSKFILSVIVEETIVYLEPYYYYAGDLYAGEV